MKDKKFWPRLASSLLVLICAVSLISFSADAAETGSLTLSYEQDGAEFKIYHVAVLRSDEYELTSGFAGYSIDLSDSDWSDLAVTLAAYVQMDSIDPEQSGIISDGHVTFSELENGLYLVMGESTTSDGYRFTPASFLVYVADGAVTSVVKFEKTPVEPETVSCNVTKIWSGDTEAVRPSAVTVCLLRDGEAYDSQELNEENEWSYTWEALDASCEWKIAEVEVAADYTVSVSQSGTSFTVTNTYHTDTPPTPSEPTRSCLRPVSCGGRQSCWALPA